MSEHFNRGHALIIGIANYLKANKLPETVLKDATDVAELLQSPDYCGYSPSNVELLLDGHATLDGIRQGLRRLAQATGPDDTAVVFFSCHGGRKESGPDAGTYLLPVDCDPDQLRETTLGSEELTALFKDVRAQKFVVLLDACHSAGAGELKALAPVPELKAGLDEKVYDRLAEGVGRVIMASSRSSEVSLVFGDMQNSLFTHYLLEALSGAAGTPGDGLIRVFDVFHYVSDKVPGRTASQHPIFKAHEVENNFPLALKLGGKKHASTEAVSAPPSTSRPRPASLSGQARLGIIGRLVTRWEDLATFLEIPLADQAKFDTGNEPRRILDWLEQRGRLQELRDAFNYLGWDDLIEELDRHPR
jgi:metacaspase-1